METKEQELQLLHNSADAKLFWDRTDEEYVLRTPGSDVRLCKADGVNISKAIRAHQFAKARRRG